MQPMLRIFGEQARANACASCCGCDFLRILAMRLLIAVSTPASGSCRNSFRACKRSSASSGQRGRLASTASIISGGAVGPLEQQTAQPFGDEVIDLFGDRRSAHRLGGGGFLEHCSEVQIQSAFEQNAQHAERGAARAERILGARRPLFDGENAGQGVDLVGEGERLPGPGRGQPVAGISRPVVLFEGQRQFSGKAFGFS